MKEKYKPFYRNDVKDWSLVESVFFGVTLGGTKALMFVVYILIFGVFIVFVKLMGVDTNKPYEFPMWAKKLFSWHFRICS